MRFARAHVYLPRNPPPNLDMVRKMLIGRVSAHNVGPNCQLSTCLIDNRAFVGAGCIIQEHSWVAEYAMLAPGSVLQPFSYIPAGQVWAGSPAKYVRDVSEDEKQFIRCAAARVRAAADASSTPSQLNTALAWTLQRPSHRKP